MNETIIIISFFFILFLVVWILELLYILFTDYSTPQTIQKVNKKS